MCEECPAFLLANHWAPELPQVSAGHMVLCPQPNTFGLHPAGRVNSSQARAAPQCSGLPPGFRTAADAAEFLPRAGPLLRHTWSWAPAPEWPMPASQAAVRVPLRTGGGGLLRPASASACCEATVRCPVEAAADPTVGRGRNCQYVKNVAIILSSLQYRKFNSP